MKRRRSTLPHRRALSKPGGTPIWCERRTAIGFGVAALVALLLWLFLPGDPYALPGGDWKLFKERFLAKEGRIVDDGNGGITHSEGQGYGMLLAVGFRDRDAFDRIWEWTSTHLKRKDDALFSWKWVPEDGGKVGDPNNASDGDLLIAWALVRAFDEWKDFKYQRAAAQIVAAIFEKATVPTYLGLQLLPGVDGFKKPEGVVTNPSYEVFPAFTELAIAIPSPKWKELAAGGNALVQTAQFSRWKLSPDWVLVAANWVELAPGHDPVFGYNAIRVPLHVAWDNPSSPALVPFDKFWSGLPSGTPMPGFVDLQTDAFGPYPALPGMQAVQQFAHACVTKAKITVRDIPRLQKDEVYFSASLKLLTKLAIRDCFGPKRN
ncbi:MAG TPA: glycosyl hydrolase family 8 [Chthoniobacterales bacterium]|jgi:endoglucanase